MLHAKRIVGWASPDPLLKAIALDLIITIAEFLLLVTAVVLAVQSLSLG
jgi:hypothetical protein